MSKRKNQDSSKSTPTAKKMSYQQDESCVSPHEDKVFVYHQGHINVTSSYLATKLADVHFVFESDNGTDTRVPAHKYLLALLSDVFEKMFYGELKENGDIKIVDATEAAFKEFLQFFYLNDVKLSAKNVASVLYLGNKFNVKNCVDACVEFLIDELSNENVCAALSLAILHKQKKLREICVMRIRLNTDEIFQTDGFLKCRKEVLAHILKMNILSCPEVNVFEACMEWVRAKSNQEILSKALVEQHLGESYYQIRFASMTTKEFCTLKRKYRQVLLDDIEAIIDRIGRADILATHSGHFNASPRQIMCNKDKDVAIVCDRENEDKIAFYSNDLDVEEKTTFSINEPLLLAEFVLNVYMDEENKETVEVKIIEDCEGLDDPNDMKVLCNMKVDLEADSDCTTITLPHPILIQSDFFYTICIKFSKVQHCSMYFRLYDSVRLGYGIEIEFSDDKENGLISEYKFNKI